MTHVLVVDDKEENLYYLTALLTGHGYAVEQARHGAEALVKARHAPPDIVVSDLLMPIMDGYTLLRHWKADPRLAKSPFIVYTATYTEPEDERLALSLGADAFVLKPAEPDDFLARLQAVLEGKVRAQATPRLASGDEKELLKVYSETLIRKLEEKTLQLEQANRELQRDIAERKRVEESLRESEERFRATFEQVAVGIAHISAEGRFIRVNDRLCTMVGYARAELLERNYADLSFPEDQANDEAARHAMLEGARRSYASEKRYRRKDGSICWVSLVATVVRGGAGTPPYFITVFDDITERRLLEERFLRVQRMESIGTLAGGIAHDLNNILAPIVMGVDLLKESVDDPHSRPVIDAIASSARRGAELVRQVLSFARGLEGARVAVHLGHVVREIETMILQTFPKGISVRTHLPKDLWLVNGDPTQLNQVVLNLCVNARDAMPDGGQLTLTLRNAAIDAQYAALHRVLQPGPYVILEVKDTGSGIPPDVLSRIFEPFFTTKGIGKGTGLGLSTALGIVRSHGGYLDVESTVGGGSTFRVHLPAQAGTSIEALATPDSSALPRGQGEVILLVDDEEAVRNVTRRTLESHGYTVLLAEDGAKAIGLFALNQDRVALVLTDMMMPNMDGATLAVALRRIKPTLPIIATSGVDSDSDMARALDAGAVAVLPKPYSARVLLNKVRASLHPGTGGSPGAA